MPVALSGRQERRYPERYVRDFDEKWLRGSAHADEPLVGSGDIQFLADLGNCFMTAIDTFVRGCNFTYMVASLLQGISLVARRVVAVADRYFRQRYPVYPLAITLI